MNVKVDENFIEIVCLLNEYFEDSNKVHAWLYTKNYNFGGMWPITLIHKGRSHKVLQFIKSAKDERKEPPRG